MKNPYETLGVDKNATGKEIKDAFKEKAKDAHPDKGGSHDDMIKLNEALSVLTDPARKARYDSGIDTEEIPFNNKLMSFYQAVLSNVLGRRPKLETLDLMKVFEESIRNGYNKVSSSIEEQQGKIQYFTEFKDRLEFKEGEDHSPMHLMMDSFIQEAEANIIMLKEENGFYDKVTEAIENYSFEHKKKERSNLHHRRPRATGSFFGTDSI